MSLRHNKSETRKRSTKPVARPTSGRAAKPVSPFAISFLDLFYPVHYKVGIGIEDALRGGRLTRHQVAILWLIRSEGEEGVRISRKQIERSITRWFELQNSAISKALRVMAREPLSLIEIREHPRSGREREVLLTETGQLEIKRMIERAHLFVQRMVDHLSDEESAQGVHFLSRVSAIIEEVDEFLGARPPARKA